MVEMLKASWLRLGFGFPNPGTSVGKTTTGNVADRIKSFFRSTVSANNTDVSVVENRNALIAIQWFVAVGTS